MAFLIHKVIKLTFFITPFYNINDNPEGRNKLWIRQGESLRCSSLFQKRRIKTKPNSFNWRKKERWREPHC